MVHLSTRVLLSSRWLGRIVDLLKGNHDAVESNYRNNLDLDSMLAVALGNSALIQGNTRTAHEAFRQGIKLENGSGERAELRHALALVYADQGKLEQANALFQESLELLDNPLNAMMWLDNAIAQTDAESALSMIQEWSKTHPTNLQLELQNYGTGPWNQPL